MAVEGACVVCYESQPPPIQSGCACRGDGGLAHINCMVQAAVWQQARRGADAWCECQTCKQFFTGAMLTGLAKAWWTRVRDYEEDNDERLGAAGNLAQSLYGEGEYAEAERIFRSVHRTYMRVLGAEHPNSLMMASEIALCLSYQEQYAKAEYIDREVYAIRKRVLGAEHPATLMSASNLAACQSHQGKSAEAEQMNRKINVVRERVLGADPPDTLMSASNLAFDLNRQGKYAEAETINRQVHRMETRLLGAAHPNTLSSGCNLAVGLFNQRKYTESEQLLEAVVEARRRVLGTAHPDTRSAAGWLGTVRSHTRAAYGVVQPLPAGTRVLVQRVFAKPEYNGKRALVLSFDAHHGRYAVALDDGKELSLKPGCGSKAGCGASGCASEEATGVCSRCQAVRYCSRECQRADWKAHKPACASAQPSAP
jgi:hypothetical protein